MAFCGFRRPVDGFGRAGSGVIVGSGRKYLHSCRLQTRHTP